MRENFKYKILTFTRYLGDAFFYPFFGLYLESLGFSKTNIGLILAIVPIISVIVHPFYSFFCKNIELTRRVLTIITIIEAILIILVSFTSNFYIMSIIVIIMAIFGGCHYSMLDSLLTVYSDQANQPYSSFRIYGSIAYIIATSISGIIIQFSSYQVSFIIASTIFIITGLIYGRLTPITTNQQNPLATPEEEPVQKQIPKILKQPDVVFFIIFYMLLMGTTYASDSFLANYLDFRGITKQQYGFIFSYHVSLEVITMIIMAKLVKKLKPHLLLVISTITLLIRLVVNGLFLPIEIVIIMIGLRGIGYGIVLSVAYSYLASLVKVEYRGQIVMIMLFFYSIYVSIFNIVNGIIIDHWGYQSFYLINIMITIITLVIALIRFKVLTPNRPNNLVIASKN